MKRFNFVLKGLDLGFGCLFLLLKSHLSVVKDLLKLCDVITTHLDFSAHLLALLMKLRVVKLIFLDCLVKLLVCELKLFYLAVQRSLLGDVLV